MRRQPVSTYRLQLNESFTFADAQSRLEYLSRLGVTDLYLSPILRPAPGSSHGYDVVDHSQIWPELGGMSGLRALSAAAHEHQMGVIADIVPNHMGIPTPMSANAQWWDVLKRGRASDFAHWFDIDFEADERIVLPVLGTSLAAALASGELTVAAAIDSRGSELRYFDHRFPIAAGTESLPLPELLSAQHYRLCWWRAGNEMLNYRRFFDVTTLVGLRVDQADVFDRTHRLILDLLDEGVIDGLRVDHPDGLADPGRYFSMLDEATSGAWTVAEKILSGEERLPKSWPVAGTTGYDAAWQIAAQLTDGAGAGTLAEVMRERTGDEIGDFPRLEDRTKRELISTTFSPEVDRLTRQLALDLAAEPDQGDHSPRAIREVVETLLRVADRYRPYSGDSQLLAAWADEAKQQLPPYRYTTVDRVVATISPGTDAISAAAALFAQVCGAVHAKALEDTTWYRWTHLTSLCEVGADPGAFSRPRGNFHEWCDRAQREMPATMTTLTSHDTKRSADVRARITALSHRPRAWKNLVRALAHATSQIKPAGLDARTEYFLWQTIAGTTTAEGFIDEQRMQQYLLKAVREQKTWTTWTESNQQGEEALARYIHHLYGDRDIAALFARWQRETAPIVRGLTLAGRCLQLMMPGVPDTYQGCETERLMLVDPDNRSNVDGPRLEAMLAAVDSLDFAAQASGLAERGTPEEAERTGAVSPTGRHLRLPSEEPLTAQRTSTLPRASGLAWEKLAMTVALLRLRTALPEAFVGDEAGYRPLATTSDSVIAFERSHRGLARALAVVPTRFPLPDEVPAAGRANADQGAASTRFGHSQVRLPSGSWRNIFDGRTFTGTITVAALCEQFPVAVLVAQA